MLSGKLDTTHFHLFEFYASKSDISIHNSKNRLLIGIYKKWKKEFNVR